MNANDVALDDRASPPRRLCDTCGAEMATKRIWCELLGRWWGPIHTECEKCEEKRQRETHEAEERRVIRIRRQRIQRGTEEAEHWGVPREYRDMSFRNFELGHNTKLAHDAALSWVKQPSGFLVFTGHTGVGKTHLSVSVGKRIWADFGRVWFWSYQDFIEQVRARSMRSCHQIIDFFYSRVPHDGMSKGTPRIILDDIVGERLTDLAKNTTYAVIDYAYRHGLPLIVSTNVPPAAFVQLFHERTASRLFGEGSKVIRITGEDRRMRKRAAAPCRGRFSTGPAEPQQGCRNDSDTCSLEIKPQERRMPNVSK